ncbi:hypothetical protein UlMin_005954 [Ulmus minor]
MASRNDTRPRPRSPSAKNEGHDEAPLDKRRRVGVQTGNGPRRRQPFASLSVNNLQNAASTSDAPLDMPRRVGVQRVAGQTGNGPRRQPVSSSSNAASSTDASSVQSAESSSGDFTKEEVEALLNEKLKAGKYDLKKRLEQVLEHNKRFKLCVKWFQQLEDNLLREQEKLRSSLELSTNKCNDTEAETKNRLEEMTKTLATLEDKLAKEQSDKLDAINSYRREKEARDIAEKLQGSLAFDLEKARQEKLIADLRASTIEDSYKRANECNTNLQEYSSKLRTDLERTSQSQRQLEKEKQAIVDSLSEIRVHNKALRDQLISIKASHDDAVKHKDSLSNELIYCRRELQQVREDRDHLVTEIQTLTAEVAKHKEFIGKSCAELDYLMVESNALEETCSSQRQRICVLEHQLIAANEKLKMADLSTSETRTEVEEQKRIVHDLQARLGDAEFQIVEGEKLRKKLHNTILELKGNIRVFCRVRPLLPNDCARTEAPVICYPTSTEALGRGIDVLHSAGQKYAFTFDKVFCHEASQQDVFVEISQLVQSALDGYKVCIFAYGQTGSGKTYTMMGRPEPRDEEGLIPRSLEQIFQISQSLQSQGWKYKMQASMLEIYNETIHDLLATNRYTMRGDNGAGGKLYNIKHDANGNTHVSDLTITDVSSMKEISSLLHQAAQSRSVGKTQMNEQSSRSHAVFTLRISGVNEGTGQQVQGVLNLIDLAGSERLSRSGATGGRLKETQAINKSLSSLSDVIFALAKKEDHVPFRNSKLTFLLQPCLGGDSKTLMFVNISPDPASVGESLCSLKFAARVNDCEIGIPRRQTTMQPADSRVSYG